MSKIDLIAIIGPTASGKTPFAAALAHRLHSEVISADSRQVYRGMDLGTGKDLADYVVQGESVAYQSMRQRGLLPILCGGTGMYVESVLRGYRLLPVPENPTLRQQLANYSLEELTQILSRYKTLHNTTDVDTAKRAIRAIEIEEYYAHTPIEERSFPQLNSLVIGLDIDRNLRREKITRRLKQRLDEGMLDEIRQLLSRGLTPDDLLYYGLEYKYLTLHVIGQLSYDEMFHQLETAIHQFAKRQMTWFRGMERRGIHIHWIDATLPLEEKIRQVEQLAGF